MTESDLPVTSTAELTDASKGAMWLLAPFALLVLGALVFVALFARDLLVDLGWLG